jgi:hypothetical protein
MGSINIYRTGKSKKSQKFIEFSATDYEKFERDQMSEKGRWRRTKESIILDRSKGGMEICRMEENDKKFIDGDGVVYAKVE